MDIEVVKLPLLTLFHALEPGKYSGESRFSIKMAMPDKVEDHMTPRNCSTFLLETPVKKVVKTNCKLHFPEFLD